uniref:Uncharacterized protein n=1 Tax=Falco tinnunculus TaxID=100819 RepID=A0A8C4V5W5_FALTI
MPGSLFLGRGCSLWHPEPEPAEPRRRAGRGSKSPCVSPLISLQELGLACCLKSPLQPPSRPVAGTLPYWCRRPATGTPPRRCHPSPQHCTGGLRRQGPGGGGPCALHPPLPAPHPQSPFSFRSGGSGASLASPKGLRPPQRRSIALLAPARFFFCLFAAA